MTFRTHKLSGILKGVFNCEGWEYWVFLAETKRNYGLSGGIVILYGKQLCVGSLLQLRCCSSIQSLSSGIFLLVPLERRM